jgi:hypothetical protein
MAFTRDWNEATPLGSADANTLDDIIRNGEVDISDRLKNMIYGFIAGENTLNQHFQYLQFYEQSSVSKPSAGYGRVYCKAVSGKCELFWQDEDENEIQLTTGGKWNGAVLSAGGIPAGSFAADAIDSDDITDGAIDSAHLAADVVDGTKMADDAVDSEHYTDGSVDPVHIANLTPDDYAGDGDGDSRQSVTFANGLIMKFGEEVVAANTTDEVTYAAAFTNGFMCAVASYKSSAAALHEAPHVQAKSGSETSVLEVTNSAPTQQTVFWMAIGY